MPKTVVICEKSSQARDLQKAFGAKYGPILPARGHILTLKEPDEVREEWDRKKHGFKAGLMWPGTFYEKKPAPETTSLLSAMRREIADADTVIIATDCDRAGQVIGDEILEHLGFKGTVKRAMFAAQDPISLKKAFDNLEDNKNYHGRYMAGQAREQSDQITNLSLTRTASAVMKAPGSPGVIGIGRVKTPVLGIVAKRELEIIDFKPQNLFEVDANTSVAGGGFILSCTKLPASLIKEVDKTAEDDLEEEELGEGEEALATRDPLRGKIIDVRVAKGIAEAAEQHKGPLSAKFENKKQGPPKLFDLAALQAACGSKFGWSAEQTLNIAQSLYASPHHILTYPRGEAQYLPETEIPNVPKVTNALLDISTFGQHAELLSDPKVRKGKSGHFSDAGLKGFSHYAIIPNVNAPKSFASAWQHLTDEQKKMFQLVGKQYLAALAPDHEYRQTTVEMTVPWKNHDWAFKNSGRVPFVAGWKEILGSGGPQNTNDEFPEMKHGENATINSTEIRTVVTRPPARYTEGALIKVMKEAWRLVEDPAQRSRLKEATGIGTGATRDQIVAGLLRQGQLTNIGKALKPTEGGLKLYKALMQACPNVVDPGRTAIWETLFDAVEAGKISALDAVKKINSMTLKEIANIQASNVQIDIGGRSKPTGKMIAAARKIAARKDIKTPRGLGSDSSICRAFLEEHLGQRPKNADGSNAPFPPSDKQIAMATGLADSLKTKIPEAALKSFKDMSTWIDAAIKKAPARPPSEKQLKFATEIAATKGIELTDQMREDSKACSKFIDDNISSKTSKGASKGKTKRAAGNGNMSGRPPSDKQIAFADKLASENGIDLPDAARTDRQECSSFIEDHIGKSKNNEMSP